MQQGTSFPASVTRWWDIYCLRHWFNSSWADVDIWGLDLTSSYKTPSLSPCLEQIYKKDHSIKITVSFLCYHPWKTIFFCSLIFSIPLQITSIIVPFSSKGINLVAILQIIQLWFLVCEIICI